MHLSRAPALIYEEGETSGRETGGKHLLLHNALFVEQVFAKDVLYFMLDVLYLEHIFLSSIVEEFAITTFNLSPNTSSVYPTNIIFPIIFSFNSSKSQLIGLFY